MTYKSFFFFYSQVRMGAVPSTSGPRSDDELDDEEPRGPAPTTTRTHLLSLCRAHNKFAVALYQEFCKDGKKPNSLLLTPLGIGLGLGMAYIGAMADTQTEMYNAFYLKEVQECHILPAYAAIHWDSLRSAMPKGCHIETAIRLFAQMEYKMTNEYEEILTSYEISRIRHVDFKRRPEVARKEINKWVEDKTHGRLKDVLPMGYVDRDTKLFLICGLYMKVQWYHSFDPKRTCKMAFHLQGKEIIEVNMMNQQNTFRVGFIQKVDADVLEMPFSNRHMKMFIFLPRKLDGISKIEKNLSRSMVDQLQDHLTEEFVDVFLPKFKFEAGCGVSEFIQKVGVKNAFYENKADFSGIDGSNELFLWRVFHHVMLEIDEAANETPAMTSFHDVGVADTKPKKIFKADHPFVFYIRDERTGAVVLIGRSVRPQYNL